MIEETVFRIDAVERYRNGGWWGRLCAFLRLLLVELVAQILARGFLESRQFDRSRMKLDAAGKFHRFLRVTIHPGELTKLRTPILEATPKGFLVIRPEDEMFEFRISQRRVGFECGTIKTRGLENHAVMKKGIRKPQILDCLATIMFQQGGQETYGFPWTRLGEYPRGEGQFHIHAGDFIGIPYGVGGFLKVPLIVKVMGKLLACVPVARILRKTLAQACFVGWIWICAHGSMVFKTSGNIYVSALF